MKKEEMVFIAAIVILSIGAMLGVNYIGKASSQFSFVAAVCDVPPTIADTYPELPYYLTNELETHRFNVTYFDYCNDTDDLTIQWFLDNSSIPYANNETYHYSPNHNSSGFHNLTIMIWDGQYGTYFTWLVEVTHAQYCGDNVCEGSEDCAACFDDCGSCISTRRGSVGGSSGSGVGGPGNASDEFDVVELSSEQLDPMDIFDMIRDSRRDVNDMTETEQQELSKIADVSYEEVLQKLDKMEDQAEGIVLSELLDIQKKMLLAQVESDLRELMASTPVEMVIVEDWTDIPGQYVAIDARTDMPSVDKRILEKMDFNDLEKDKHESSTNNKVDVESKARVIELEYLDGSLQKIVLLTKSAENNYLEEIDLRVIVVIPKIVVQNVNAMKAITSYEVINPDPVIGFRVDGLEAGNVEEFEFVVKKELDLDSVSAIKTIAVIGEQIPSSPTGMAVGGFPIKLTAKELVIVGVLLVVLFLIIWKFRGKKKRRKKKKTVVPEYDALT